MQEIRGYEAVTAMANSPDYLKGVINLRGVIVPIIDMRIKFNMCAPTYDQFTVVVILKIGQQTIGMVVDSVSDVVLLNADEIKPAPEMGAILAAEYLKGLGTIGERMLILLDIDKLMASDDMGFIPTLQQAA